jgi:D-sedoheptulose 7-phosphate isomerase
MKEARKRHLKTISLTGKDGGALAKCVDTSVNVASANTARIQECHIAIGHVLCELVEMQLFSESNPLASSADQARTAEP